MNTPAGIQVTHDSPVHTGTGVELVEPLAAAAGLGWLGVGVFGMWDVVRDGSGEGPPYVLFAFTLVLAATLTLAAAGRARRPPHARGCVGADLGSV